MPRPVEPNHLGLGHSEDELLAERPRGSGEAERHPLDNTRSTHHDRVCRVAAGSLCRLVLSRQRARQCPFLRLRARRLSGRV